MRVLHIIPDSAANPRDRSQHFLGSTKDVYGRTEYFASRGIQCARVVVHGRRDSNLLASVRAMQLDDYRYIFVELPLYPNTLRYLRRTYPHCVLIVRSINAELFHKWHYLLASWPSLKSWHLRVLFSRFILDWQSARLSDYLLSITDWETMHYWRHIVGSDRVRTLPYFLPACYLPHNMEMSRRREKIAICMVGCHKMTVFHRDALRRFFAAIDSLGDTGRDWVFKVMGVVNDIDIPPRVQVLGCQEDPFHVLGTATAMVLLSDYGYGFKTKILDAAAAGARTIVTGACFSRLPTAVRSCCVPVEKGWRTLAAVFLDGLNRCDEPFSGFKTMNEVLRKRSFSILDDVFQTG